MELILVKAQDSLGLNPGSVGFEPRPLVRLREHPAIATFNKIRTS